MDQPKSDRTPEQELARAGAARRVLEDPIFIEACNALDAQLRLMRESVPMQDTEMHTRLILAEQVQGKVLDYLRGVMIGGEYARMQLREKESLAERMKNAMRLGIRA